MDENDYLTSDELRLLTGRGSSFLQIEMLNKHKIPYCLDEYGTPLVRIKEVREFSMTINSQSTTEKILNRIRSKWKLNRTSILPLAAESGTAELCFLGFVNEVVLTASKLGLYVRFSILITFLYCTVYRTNRFFIYKPLNIIIIPRAWLSVNPQVPGSSPGRGAKIRKVC